MKYIKIFVKYAGMMTIGSVLPAVVVCMVLSPELLGVVLSTCLGATMGMGFVSMFVTRYMEEI